MSRFSKDLAESSREDLGAQFKPLLKFYFSQYPFSNNFICLRPKGSDIDNKEFSQKNVRKILLSFQSEQHDMYIYIF
jgi:hypothetical protein